MSKKRAREVPSVDVSLVEVYEDLAHEDEAIRLKAAHSLLTKHFPNASDGQSGVILKRLFRGLCSGRKAARLGFSVALTECLSQVKQEDQDSVTATAVLDTLESSTIPETGTSGQDERDHYFGRLFGSDAIIKSSLLFTKAEAAQWLRLLDIVCGISAKKPWLRQECGWILYNCVQQLENLPEKSVYVISIAEKLVQHKLIRTPEGLAIWIAIQHQIDGAKLPKNVWRHGSPLAKKDLATLAQILKDARSAAKDQADYESQGGAIWSAQLHFAWEPILQELFDDTTEGTRVEFGDFWLAAVDEGLFAPSNSPERKYWGLLLLQKVITSAPPRLLDKCFTKNTTSCLMQSLKADNRYLQKGAQKVLRTFQARAKDDATSAVPLIYALLKATNFVDFDTTTKTKTIEKVLSSANEESVIELSNVLRRMLLQPEAKEGEEASDYRKKIINLQMKIMALCINNAASNPPITNLGGPRHILRAWTDLLGSRKEQDLLLPQLSEPTKLLVRQKLATSFEQILKLGNAGRLLALECIVSLKSWDLSADQEILDVLAAGWKRFKIYHKLAEAGSSNGHTNGLTIKEAKANTSLAHQSQNGVEGVEGFALLYGLVIFQIYSDEPEAISILEELIAFEDETVQHTKSKELKLENADGLVEILLSFASKSSKFLRRITLDIFEAFTAQITREGLQALVSILQTKESKAGQEELFEAEGEIVEAGVDGNSEEESDIDTIGSDVEMIDMEDDLDDNSASSESGSESDDESSSPDEADDELIALEKSLATALGTRKLTADDLQGSSSGPDSDSDSDMDDDQMMSLDEKLSEVFRTRADAQSESKNKQKENKAAKENMTNFKNRVLDMLDIYFKHEFQNSNALDLVVPLLQLARVTTVKQLSTKAIELLKSFCNRCKGLHNVPSLADPPKQGSKSKLPKGTNTNISTPRPHNEKKSAIDILSAIHNEVSLPSSNAHKSACSQASILLAKTLAHNGVNIEEVVAVYARTQVKMILDDTNTVQEAFFRDWINWCGSVRGKLEKK